MRPKRNPVGIRARHSRTCGSHEDTRCNCRPAYEAAVFSKRDGKKLRKTFPTLAAARRWRNDALGELDRGRLRALSATTVRESADRWVERARQGAVRNRSGDTYKPSAIRSYEEALRLRVVPEFGAVRLSDLARADLQRFVGRLLSDGMGASTIRNTLLPLPRSTAMPRLTARSRSTPDPRRH
jgi:integrase